jgi:glycerol-3-phosphate dehydrogenase (NAD(P)+)
MSQVAVLGAGSWGTALAVLLAAREPLLWDHRSERAAAVRASRQNERYLPGVHIPESVRIVEDLATAIDGTSTLVAAVPSHAMRDLARALARTPAADRQQVIVNVSKGLELDSRCRMSEVLASELPQPAANIVSLVGPSHAEEVARGMPTTVVVAGTDESVLRRTQELFTTETFRVYTNPDLVGVELAVSLKNVIAIAAGICDGLGFGDNSRGALLTRGLAEMARLGLALGARMETFAGLAGLGDLVTTATSRHSRNRNLGEAIGKGRGLDAALADLGQVAEGVHTTRAAVELAQQHDIEMPIATQVHEILFRNKDPKVALRDLMLRAPKAETWSATRGAP